MQTKPEPKIEKLTVKIVLIGDLIEEIGAVKGGDDAERVAEFERRLDVVSDLFRRGRGEGGDWAIREEVGDLPELQVVFAEVVSPLRDAMRFVDREKTRIGAA